jgi:hypothetical protein
LARFKGCETKIFGLQRRNCILLYRGFPIRKPPASPLPAGMAAPCRLEIGDTADWEIGDTKNFVSHPDSRKDGQSA